MKKTILAVAMLFATMVSAQDAYVALSGGVASQAGVGVLSSNTGALEGSYGAGYQGQARFGYMLTEKFGVDLGVGYLHGDAQQILDTNGLNVVGKSRAFGASLAGVYNFSKNVYMRAGLLTKVAGKTLIDASLNSEFNELPLAIEVKRENTGKFPLGFVGAFGLKFDLGNNFGLFVEMDYQGINVTSNKSVLTSSSISYGGNEVSKDQLFGGFSAAAGQIKAGMNAGLIPVSVGMMKLNQIQSATMQLGGLLADEITYVEGTPDRTKFEDKAVDAPYSSFGFNIGVTYSFDFK